MSDYGTLFKGWLAVNEEMSRTVTRWYNSVHDRQITDISGKEDKWVRPGDTVDAWRHAGVAALVAHEKGYDFTIKIGNAVEARWVGPIEENDQDYHNNELGARLGNMARILGWDREQLGDALKKAYRDGKFQDRAYGPRVKRLDDIEVPGGMILKGNNQLSVSGVLLDLKGKFGRGRRENVWGVSGDGDRVKMIIDRDKKRILFHPKRIDVEEGETGASPKRNRKPFLRKPDAYGGSAFDVILQ